MLKLFSKNKEASSSGIDFLIVGLGNPGKKYENSRHNTGFMFADAIAGKYNTSLDRIKFKGLCSRITVGDKKVLLLKPSTYMNLSGQSVTEAMAFYKLKPEQVLVALDDITLPVGKLRIRRKGSDGGQNGMKNIIYLSGSDNFPRIKIGIGAKPHPDYDLAAWVLSSFDSKEKKLLDEAIENAVSAAELIVSGDIDKAMNCYN